MTDPNGWLQIATILGGIVTTSAGLYRRLGRMESRQRKHGARLTKLWTRVVRLESKLE